MLSQAVSRDSESVRADPVDGPQLNGRCDSVSPAPSLRSEASSEPRSGREGSTNGEHPRQGGKSKIPVRRLAMDSHVVPATASGDQ